MGRVKKCAVCGEIIPDTRTSNNLKYCGPKCAREAEAQQNIGRIAKRATKINRIARSAYIAYECKCALCGWQATDKLISHNGNYQYAHGCELHHITPIRAGGEEDPGNIILLCPNHHKQADLGIISPDHLRKYTKNFKITEEKKTAARNESVDRIATAIFG